MYFYWFLLVAFFSSSIFAAKPKMSEAEFAALVVQRAAQAQTLSGWSAQYASKSSQTLREKTFGSMAKAAFPKMFSRGNNIFVYSFPHQLPVALSVKLSKDGERWMTFLEGKNITIGRKESEAAWLWRVFGLRAEQVSLWKFILPEAQAESNMFENFLNASVALTIKDMSGLTQGNADSTSKANAEAMKKVFNDLSFQCVEKEGSKYSGASYKTLVDGYRVDVNSAPVNSKTLVEAQMTLNESGGQKTISRYSLNDATGSFRVYLGVGSEPIEDWKLLPGDFLHHNLVSPILPAPYAEKLVDTKGAPVNRELLSGYMGEIQACTLGQLGFSSLHFSLFKNLPYTPGAKGRAEFSSLDKDAQNIRIERIKAGSATDESIAAAKKLEKFLDEEVGCRLPDKDSCMKAIGTKCVSPELAKTMTELRAASKRSRSAWRMEILKSFEEMETGKVDFKTLCTALVMSPIEDEFLTASNIAEQLQRRTDNSYEGTCLKKNFEKIRALNIDFEAIQKSATNASEAERTYSKQRAEFESKLKLRSEMFERIKNFTNAGTKCCRDTECREVLDTERSIIGKDKGKAKR